MATITAPDLHAAPAERCVPATLRVGLLGLGTVGSAVARLTRTAAETLRARGVSPVIATALVRSAARTRAAGPFVTRVTDEADDFFARPHDVIIEVLGGVDPAREYVRRALDRGIPVVTANKSLVAAHGDALAALARRRGTALRFEAACIAGVPFLGTFERRPLAARVRGVTGILNGTSNAIITALAAGTPFDAALEAAQQRGLAEPDPSADLSGADAAQKLAILVRLYGQLLVSPRAIPATPLDVLDPGDLSAAAEFGGVIRPVAHASWDAAGVRAFVAPAFLPAAHPLASVAGAANGLVLDAAGGAQCYIGPGAGPDVTAATVLDDVVEIATERRVRTPAPLAAREAGVVGPAETAWFIRLEDPAGHAALVDLLGSYGTWCSRVAALGGRTYVLTFPASASRIEAALRAFRAATRTPVLALPALVNAEGAC